LKNRRARLAVHYNNYGKRNVFLLWLTKLTRPTRLTMLGSYKKGDIIPQPSQNKKVGQKEPAKKEST
jgi:hypothetical protein